MTATPNVRKCATNNVNVSVCSSQFEFTPVGSGFNKKYCSGGL